MLIKETTFFTKIIQELMPDELYCKLQHALIRQPDLGDLMPGSAGLRKLRWRLSDKGKRGGVRVIYYWLRNKDQILMIYAYQKAKQENLTVDQLKQLKTVVQEELCDG